MDVSFPSVQAYAYDLEAHTFHVLIHLVCNYDVDTCVQDNQ